MFLKILKWGAIAYMGFIGIQLLTMERKSPLERRLEANQEAIRRNSERIKEGIEAINKRSVPSDQAETR